tara:strand:- start:1472 stop:2953 length:1482 start_codon:yes stop_codon:yes gene_type:complete
MRLLRLTTRKDKADFEATYNADIVLKPNSKIALQSVSINSQDTLVDITTDNNEIQYGINSSYNRTIQLTPRVYQSGDVAELLKDLTTKLNNSCTFTDGESKKVLGLEWQATRDVANKIAIGYKRGLFGAFTNAWDFTNTQFTSANPQPFLASSNDVSVSDFSVNALLGDHMSRGNGFFRVRTRKLETGNTKNGYLIGLYTDGDITGTTLALASIKYGIRVSFNGAQRVYRTIVNGVESATETNMNDYFALNAPTNSNVLKNEYQEIAINGATVEINIYRSETPTKTTLASFSYDQEKFRPVVAFFGSRSTTQIDMVRFTRSPYSLTALDSPPATDSVSQVGAPPRPANSNNAADNFLFFQSIVVADYLGFNNQRSPVNGFTGANELTYTANREFDVPEVADAMLVLVNNLQVESYDSYSDLLTTRNGERSNILSVIPSKSSAGKIVYEPPYLTFIELQNKDPIYLRNLNMRVVREDYSEISIVGLGTIVVIID